MATRTPRFDGRQLVGIHAGGCQFISATFEPSIWPATAGRRLRMARRMGRQLNQHGPRASRPSSPPLGLPPLVVVGRRVLTGGADERVSLYRSMGSPWIDSEPTTAMDGDVRGGCQSRGSAGMPKGPLESN